MVFCSSQMLEKFSSHESKTSDLKIFYSYVVTTLTFVVTCDYIDFFLANLTVNHNVHTFTIIVHGYLFHSFLINVVNYNVHT